MFVAASTACFRDLPLEEACDRLVGLEYSHVEIPIDERAGQLRPSQVAADPQAVSHLCRQTQRLTPVAYSVDIDATGDAYYEQFYACCRLAKATKVVTLTVPSAELGTPFNAEIERLRELVRLAAIEGVRVGVKTEVDRMTQDPETALVLCDHVKGLGVTLDPSHYICGPHGGGPYDKLFPHVYHVQLRDTSKDKLQVKIGQGEIDYGRLVAQLQRARYDRALCVDIVEEPDIYHVGELRKMRLLLESLL